VRFRYVRATVVSLGAILGAGAVAGATVVQDGNVRITVLSQVTPYKLPREGTVPIAISVSGHLKNPEGGVPPQLTKLSIKVNRRGVLYTKGLPVCRPAEIHSVTTEQALDNCAPALVGSGRFWANIVFSGQPPYPTKGRLLVFNGHQDGRPALFAQIFTSHPFNSSFVIPFLLRRIPHGSYGTQLTAELPAALGSWGYLDRIKLNLKRKFRYRGQQRSYFRAGCPALTGTDRSAFSLAKASFYFAERKPVEIPVVKACQVKN
jgi:hypothetical protein